MDFAATPVWTRPACVLPGGVPTGGIEPVLLHRQLTRGGLERGEDRVSDCSDMWSSDDDSDMHVDCDWLPTVDRKRKREAGNFTAREAACGREDTPRWAAVAVCQPPMTMRLPIEVCVRMKDIHTTHVRLPVCLSPVSYSSVSTWV
jgi:hypothetical protein